MFFILSKIAYFFIAPFTWLMLAVFLWFFAKKSKWNRIGKWATVIIIIFFSNTFIFKECMRQWEIHAIPIENIEHHEVGIVLGGMADYDNDAGRITLGNGGDRIWQAIDLYKQRKIDKILISGDDGYVTDRGLNEALQLKEVLVRWGIPERDLIAETVSKNTHENAQETAKLLQQSYPQFSSFLLITSTKHMRRAKACFEKEGLKVTPFSTDPFTSAKRSYYWDEFIVPNADNFSYWFELNKEIIGFLVYDIVGYI
ncbi:MAG: YdcF family protein [Brumimicrobium sp.]|nr:YdcF family protein [Brumimicrobium sp.]